MTKLYVVIPCYFEADALPYTAEILAEKMNKLIATEAISPESRVLLVNDGSTDGTWEIIYNLHVSNSLFAGLNLSRNRGHQNALLAGLMFAKEHADAVISMDADLQDDINAIDQMLGRYLEGADIVYGVRTTRKKDTIFKRTTALGFYKFMRLLGVDIVYNHADYRLLSRRAINALSEFSEVNLFLRGMVPMLGFKTATVEYERNERVAGETKYPLRKMLSFAVEGITSLSVRPIRLISVFGFASFLICIAFIAYFLFDHIRGGTVPGWASTIISIWAIGGLQLFAIGIIGEYIGKIYLEAKARPRYIVSEVLHDKKDVEKNP